MKLGSIIPRAFADLLRAGGPRHTKHNPGVVRDNRDAVIRT